MTRIKDVDKKISKISEWILYESNSSFDEIEHLLFAIYYPKISGLSGNIDDDYRDVLDIMYNRDEEPSPFKKALNKKIGD